MYDRCDEFDEDAAQRCLDGWVERLLQAEMIGPRDDGNAVCDEMEVPVLCDWVVFDAHSSWGSCVL